MQYFKDCTTLDEAKKVYRTLLMQYHPDKQGGSHTRTIDLINQFKTFRPKVNEGKNQNFDFDEFHDLVMKFENLNSLTISFVGSWIWIEGDTYSQKDKIKAIVIEGYNTAYFASKKKAWYIAPKQKGKKRRSSGKSLETIKATYGNQTYKTKKIKQIA
jgi:hypothetical protein